jgi:hypothetical protein
VWPIDIDLYDPVPPIKAVGIDLDLNLFPYLNKVTYDPIPLKKAAGIDLNWKMFPYNKKY